MIRLLRIALAAIALCAWLGAAPQPERTSPPAALSATQRDVLARYMRALEAGNYGAAFALLTTSERHYFGTPANYASAYGADGIQVLSHKLLGAILAPPQGALAIVSERVRFFDHVHQGQVTATARVAYGLINDAGSVRVKDPYHPWRALLPKDAAVTQDGLRVVVRKVSFFTGRVEFLVTFANLGDGAVTLLPYGRSVLHDDAGHVYHLIETKLPGLTDRNLRLGLRLPGDAQYTGSLTFATPDRFVPKTLTLTLSPQLRDGADAPFEVDLPAIPVGA